MVGGLPQASSSCLAASISTASGDTVWSDIGWRVLVLGVVSSDWGDGEPGTVLRPGFGGGAVRAALRNLVCKLTGPFPLEQP